MLGAAADDLYEMKEFAPAIGAAQRLIDGYPQAEPSIRRDAWAVVAHSSIETGDYPKAELAYTRVLEMTPEGDDTRQSVVDNLAASIYKQGEQAKLAAGPPRGRRPLPADQAGGAQLEDQSARRVRRRRGADPAEGLGGRHRRCWTPSGRRIRTTS